MPSVGRRSPMLLSMLLLGLWRQPTSTRCKAPCSTPTVNSHSSRSPQRKDHSTRPSTNSNTSNPHKSKAEPLSPSPKTPACPKVNN